VGLRRGLLLAVAASAVAFAAPVGAQAADFCVNRAGCPAPNTFTEDGLQTALIAADAAAGPDRVLIGAGVYDDGPYTAGSGNQVEIVGAGATQTILRKAGAAGDQTVLTVSQAASSVRDLGIELTNGNNLTGLSIRNSATAVRVFEAPTSTGNRTGIDFTAAGVLVDSSVALELATGTTAVRAVLPGGTGELTLQNNDLQAANGVAFQTPIHTERNRITARIGGIAGTGPLDIDNAAIRMVGGGGPNAPAVSVASSQVGPTPLAGQLNAQHVTAIGPGSGFGIVIGAGCNQPTPGANVQVVPANGQVRDSLVDGFATDFLVAGRQCPDPVLVTNIPSFASLDVDYSLFDPAAVTEFEPATFSAGANNRSGDPRLVDPAGGNLRPAQNSPAIDSGQPTPAAGNERDVAGNPRVQDGNGDGTSIRDMGAYEHTSDPGPGDPGPPGPGGNITRTLTLGYKAKTEKFKGKLKSNEAACLAGKVKVFEKAKGKDPKAGSDKTNAAGKWSFEEEDADGKFYATVPQKTVPAGACPAARSKTKKL
jgi:hypothetical protein